jgi:hypothetical protein
MAQNQLVNDLAYMPFSAHIAPFAPTLSPLIAESLTETSQDRYRKGTFLTPTMSIWFVLAMTIRRDLNYHKVLDWMSSTWRWMTVGLPVKLVQDGAISHARVKLGVDVFLLLFQKVACLLSRVAPDFYGFVTVRFDGTTLSMPDTPSNHEHFGKHTSLRGPSGFPLMRVVTLMVRAGRVMVDVAFAPIVGKGTGERTLMHQILPRVTLQNALFLFDAGFYSFVLLHSLDLFKHHFLRKISSSVHITPLRHGRFPDGSYLAVIREGKSRIRHGPGARGKHIAILHIASGSSMCRCLDSARFGSSPTSSIAASPPRNWSDITTNAGILRSTSHATSVEHFFGQIWTFSASSQPKEPSVLKNMLKYVTIHCSPSLDGDAAFTGQRDRDVSPCCLYAFDDSLGEGLFQTRGACRNIRRRSSSRASARINHCPEPLSRRAFKCPLRSQE